jgi:hypothetical protein
MEIFWEEDAANILAIPVHAELEDTIAWHFDPKGLFSVKSVYHVLDDETQRNKWHQRGEGLTLLAAARRMTYGPKFGSLHAHQK